MERKYEEKPSFRNSNKGQENLSPEEMEKLGAAFVNMLNQETKQDSSNWREFYTILKEASMVKDTEKCKSGKGKTDTPKNTQSQSSGFKVDTQATKEQYKSSDYTQQQSSSFSGKHCKAFTSNHTKTKSNTNFEETLKRDYNDTDMHRDNKMKERFESNNSNHGIRKTSKQSKRSQKKQTDTEDTGRQNIGNKKQSTEYAEPMYLFNSINKSFLERFCGCFSKYFKIFKEVLFYFFCLMLMILLILLRLLWNSCMFVLKLIAICSLWITVKFMQMLSGLDTKYMIFAKISHYISVTVDIFHLVTGINVKRLLSRDQIRTNDVNDDDAEDGNVQVPLTSEDAVRFLLKQKEQKPFRTLCVTKDATDNDVKVNYRKLALLVHPDKCPNVQADEAFKILDTAFRKLSDPIKRLQVIQEAEKERQWKEFQKTHGEDFKKMFEELLTTIQCSVCSGKHKRTLVKERNFLEARYCGECDKKHSAQDGDLWAESCGLLGYGWVCYLCMDGEVYAVTEWAICQNLRNVLPVNHHRISCRVGNQATQHRSSRRHHRQEESEMPNGRQRKSRKGRKGK